MGCKGKGMHEVCIIFLYIHLEFQINEFDLLEGWEKCQRYSDADEE